MTVNIWTFDRPGRAGYFLSILSIKVRQDDLLHRSSIAIGLHTCFTKIGEGLTSFIE